MCGGNGGGGITDFMSMATLGFDPIGSLFKGPSAPPPVYKPIPLPQEAHAADLSALYDANAKKAMKGSATQLTGPGGVDPKNLSIGYNSLLG